MARSGTLDLDAMREHADAASSLLKALANPQRLRLLCHLAGGELSVGELHRRVDLSQSALSQHLARLRGEGLVATRREAQTIYYGLASGPVREIIRTLHGIYCGVPAAPRRAARGRKTPD
jgi:DNA-binding transcriptional ArsR family regulator